MSTSPPRAAPLRTASPNITIQKRVEEVRINFSVEQAGKLLKNLPPDAFTIYDDEHAVPAFTAFSEDSNLPLRVGLLIDRSDSVHKEFAAEQSAAILFLKNVVRPSVDSIFLLDFTHELKFRSPHSDDLQMLSDDVNALAPGGQTALYDALYAAAHFGIMTANETQPVRRVMILLSDGEDDYSLHGLDDAITAAQQMDISIYAITVHGRAYHRGDAVLQTIAEETGGRAFVLPDLRHLGDVFVALQDELRSAYSVSFHPVSASSCGYHALRVQPHDRKLNVHARQGYYGCRP